MLSAEEVMELLAALAAGFDLPPEKVVAFARQRSAALAAFASEKERDLE